jgi:hypothetical protein
MSENRERLSLTDFLGLHGCSLSQVVEGALRKNGLGPALCARGCTVALDATCPHGCPSVLLSIAQFGYEWEDILDSGSE